MSSIERLPPHSIEAEEAVLGSLLIDPDAIFDVASLLKPESFYRVQNRWIYECIVSLHERREPLDLITVTEELRRREKLEEIGGEGYIIGLINTVPTSINARNYGQVVEAAALRRRMIKAASTIAELAFDEAEDVNVAIDRAEQTLFSISEERTTRDLTPIKQIASNYLERIQELHERGEDVIGVPTGFVDLDRILGGFNRSDLIILAARPGMGKCVTADTQLVNPHTGELTDIETLVKQEAANLLTLGHNYKLRPGQASHFVDSGLKPVYRVTTALGRQIKTTLSHPFLTLNGWRPLHQLTVGDRVAVPRVIPVFGQDDAPDCQVKVLAYMLADGSMRGRSPQFTNSNPVLRDDFVEAEETLLSNGHAYSSQINNTLTDWLQSVGVWGETAVTKTLPSLVYRYPRPKLALFLNRLFACDGSVYQQNQRQPVVSYTTASELLAHGVVHLLLRFGIIAKLRRRRIKYQGGHRPAYQIRITGRESLLVFAQEIGALGKEAPLAQVVAQCKARPTNSNLDTIPIEVWDQIAAYKGERSWANVQRAMGLASNHNIHVGRRAPGRERLAALATGLDAPELHNLAQSDVYWDKIVAIDPLGEQQVYDLTVPDTHNFVADNMIVHNTSLQNAVALTAARRHGKRIAMFNLEMSGEQLVQRMISAETRIDSQRLRRGDLQEHEWPIFMEAIGRLSETRIFIDDTPSITPNQLRTKCRRLYAEHGLDMVMIDYLQLMQAERSTNNRVQEISEISRALKGLARELDVPVVAAAQLSRAVEQRQEKRPLLSDLRDSGCLTGDTLVKIADTGQRIPIRQLVGQKGFCVWALNETTWQLETAEVSRAFSTGIKQTYRLTTRLGRTIKATGNHKFRTFAGWQRLDQLSPGDFLALPRRIPDSINKPTLLDQSELALLAYLIGDGCVLPRHAIQYTTQNDKLANTVAELARTVFTNQLVPRVQQERNWYQVYLPAAQHLTHGIRNPISEWFETLGIFGLRSHEKFVPEVVFQQSEENIAVFLRHLWSTDGCINMRNGKRPYPAIFYATSSQKLAYGVQTLLLHLSINARVKQQPQGKKGRDQFHVIISGQEDVLLFVDLVGTVGSYRASELQKIRNHISTRISNTNRDVIPHTVWRQQVVPAMQAQGITTRQMQADISQPYCGTSLYKQNVSRARIERVAQAVNSTELDNLAKSDVYWDKVVAVEPLGEEEVFDLTVPGPHNFIANNIIVHNSIEQDADIVMFIYRDEYYNGDTSERPNIAEIHIAKHRNGPTGTIDLFWHEKLATFRNLQRQEINL